MRERRTDLALEAKELWEEGAEKAGKLSGVRSLERQREGVPVTEVEILDSRGARTLGRPVGKYLTLTLDGLQRREEGAFSRAARAVAAELKSLLPPVKAGETVLVACLGNRAITPDAIGPKVHSQILVTRHLLRQMPGSFPDFRPVASVAPGVLGETGMESCEVVRSLCGSVEPACVIAVDALASRSLHRLCRTVQLSDTGIAPGSGVGNHRMALGRETLGVPVIAVGVPTVVEASTLAADLMGMERPPDLGPGGGLLVTPRDIDSQVADLGKVIAYGIDLALQPGMTVEELDMLLS